MGGGAGEGPAGARGGTAGVTHSAAGRAMALSAEVAKIDLFAPLRAARAEATTWKVRPRCPRGEQDAGRAGLARIRPRAPAATPSPGTPAPPAAAPDQHPRPRQPDLPPEAPGRGAGWGAPAPTRRRPGAPRTRRGAC